MAQIRFFIIFKASTGKNLSLSKTRFLLVDDDADDAGLFCEALGQIDPVIQCDSVENGREVFNYLSAHHTKPDVIFLDINMPVMNGWDCLKKLKEDPNHRAIPTIVYSTSTAKRDIETAYMLGALVYITKPEDFTELYNILKIVATNPQDSLVQNLLPFASVKLR